MSVIPVALVRVTLTDVHCTLYSAARVMYNGSTPSLHSFQSILEFGSGTTCLSLQRGSMRRYAERATVVKIQAERGAATRDASERH